MKFLCPSCKAKYKIADEKVAGRASARMKCRKCGAIIPILKAAAEYPSDHAGEEGEGEAPEPPAGAPAMERESRAEGVSRLRPEPPRPPAKPAPAAPISSPTAAPELRRVEDFEEDAPTVMRDASALAEAFSQALGGAAPGGDESAGLGTEDRPSAVEQWYVGIDGSPEGPLTAAQLQQKARAGRVTPEALVWREGFEEWTPLSAFPELLSLVNEAEAMGDAAPEPAPASLAAARESASGGRESSAEEPLLPVAGMPGTRSRTPLAVWVAMLVAIAFGVTIGVVFFSSSELKEVIKVKYVEVPASAAAAAAEAPEEEEEEEEEAPPDEDEKGAAKPVTRQAGAPAGPGAQGASPTAPESQSAGGKGLLAGLKGLQGSGPQVGPASQSGSSGGRELDGASIQRTVRNYTPSVRRSCWQPALDTRSRDAPSSARVAVTITVAPSGAVQDVSTSGDPNGYRGLARCIESRVRGWRFPAAGSSTTVQVPFVFAAQ